MTRSGLFGPWDAPDLGVDALPAGVNPGQAKPWGLDSFQLWPNFVILIWERGWYLTYHYWPTSHNTHVFEGNLYFVPAEDRARAARAGDGGGDVQGVRAAGRQHARGDADHARVARGRPRSRSTTRRSCAATCTRWPPTGSTTTSASARRWADERRRLLPAEFADLEPFAATWCLRDRARALRAAHGELDGRDAGVLRRVLPARRGSDRLLRQVPARRPARRRAAACCSCSTRSSWCRSRSRRGASRTSPTAAPRTSTSSSSRARDRSHRDPIVLRADRWVDIDAGEVRSPRSIVVEGERIAAVNPAELPSAATEIDLGDVTLLPGLMDMELNMLLGGPQRREPAQRRAGRPRVPHAARRSLNCRTTLLAGFTTVRNLGLFVKTGGYLLDVALVACDRQRLDRRPAPRAGRARDHADRRPPRPDDVPAARRPTSCR